VPDYRALHLGLALAVVGRLGLDKAAALASMQQLARDRYDFHVADCGGAELAMAFSANDPASTAALFRSLDWPKEETRLLYNHRSDRPARFRSFRDWLRDPSWREVLVTGDRPWGAPGPARYVHLANAAALLRLLQPGDRVFGCGNVAGLPMALAAGAQ
jgi:hypothetical protein